MKTTLKSEVLKYLKKRKPLTAYQAFLLFGTLRLADVMHRLRHDGHTISTKLIAYKTKRYGTVNIAEYRLTK